jgi:hypothetical protein
MGSLKGLPILNQYACSSWEEANAFYCRLIWINLPPPPSPQLSHDLPYLSLLVFILTVWQAHTDWPFEVVGIAHCKDTIPKMSNKYSQKRNWWPQSQFLHSCVCEEFLHSHDQSAYYAAGKYVDRSWEYMGFWLQCGEEEQIRRQQNNLFQYIPSIGWYSGRTKFSAHIKYSAPAFHLCYNAKKT